MTGLQRQQIERVAHVVMIQMDRSIVPSALQEQVEREGNLVRIGSGHRCGQNVRAAGEDVATGQQVFSAGRRLTAADIGVLEQTAPGEFAVRSAGAQGSGILRSMSETNCFILLDPDRTSVEIGEEVEVQPFLNLI